MPSFKQKRTGNPFNTVRLESIKTQQTPRIRTIPKDVPEGYLEMT